MQKDYKKAFRQDSMARNRFSLVKIHKSIWLQAGLFSRRLLRHFSIAAKTFVHNEKYANTYCGAAKERLILFCHSLLMTPLAQKLDARFQKLDPETLQLLEGAFLSVLTVVEHQTGVSTHPKTAPSSSPPYRLPAYSLGVRDGIDPTKLVHASEEE